MVLSDFRSIYLPAKDAGGRPLPDRDAVLEWLLVELARAYGGATATQVEPGRGAWVTPAGVVVVEPIAIVKSYVAAGAGDGRLRDLAGELKARARQESVAIETARGMEFV